MGFSLKPEHLNAMVRSEWPESQFVCEAVGEDSAIAYIDIREEVLRPGGYVSGPTLFAAADAALWFLAAVVAGEPVPMALTSDLSIRYLRPAIGGRVYAHATLDKGSRRTVIGSVSIWMDDQRKVPSAIAQGSYVLPPDIQGGRGS